MTLRLSVLLPVLLMLFAGAAEAQEKNKPAAAGEKRTVGGHRPDTKGTKYEITVKGLVRYSEDYTVRGKHLDFDPPGELKVSLEGRMEVVSVTPRNGRWSAVKITVKRLTFTGPAGVEEKVKEGAVITATAGKDYSAIELDGKTPPAQTGAAIRAVLPPVTDYDEPVGNIFVSPGPVAPGEEWKPDFHKAQRMLSMEYRGELDPDKSTATVRYDGPEKVAGQEGDAFTTTLKLVYTGLDGFGGDRKFKSATSVSSSVSTMPRDPGTAGELHTKFTLDVDTQYETHVESDRMDVKAKMHRELEVFQKRLETPR